jgi:7,8-dihydropterin-6-yl-methyl-4-(beta-D-ribofuranosyl)aminobenzene 5'-phosphate synthase
MTIPDDLKTYFAGFRLWHGIVARIIIFFAIALTAFAWIVVVRGHREGIAQVDQIWRTREMVQVGEFGTTKSLRITPLVNWHAASPKLKTEAGVSYLVETDGHKILFDLGWNENNTSPSPLVANMNTLGVSLRSIDTVFLSHAHRDHMGGSQWQRQSSFSLDGNQLKLHGKRVFASAPLVYPGLKVERVVEPQRLLDGIASTGPIARKLFIGRIDEQALVVNLQGKGLVVIVGCGHQTLPRLLQRIEESFHQPIYAIVGDLHYPIPDGRLNALGINLQRVLASGSGPTDPITRSDIEADIVKLQNIDVGLVALGGHDTSDEILNYFAQVFGNRYRSVKVGDPITIQ